MPRTSGCDDALPLRPNRILVTGASGSGKTWVAARVSETLGIPHTELDGLYHGAGWTPRRTFVDDVRALVAQPRWVTEWGYSAARSLLLARADTMVWLDLPRWRVLTQIVPRTVRRRLLRTELWNGNVEPPLWTILTDRDHIIRWSFRTHPDAVRRVRDVLAGEYSTEVHVVRLRSRAEMRRWLRGPLAAAAAAP